MTPLGHASTPIMHDHFKACPEPCKTCLKPYKACFDFETCKPCLDLFEACFFGCLTCLETYKACLKSQRAQYPTPHYIPPDFTALHTTPHHTTVRTGPQARNKPATKRGSLSRRRSKTSHVREITTQIIFSRSYPAVMSCLGSVQYRASPGKKY